MLLRVCDHLVKPLYNHNGAFYYILDPILNITNLSGLDREFEHSVVLPQTPSNLILLIFLNGQERF